MKITVFVLSIVLLASVLFSVSVFSSDSTENKTVETFEECSLERSCTRSNAPASREVSFDGSFSKKVAYDSTRNYTIDKQLDVYLDNDGTLYMFNDKSEITMSQISDVKVSKVLAAIKKGYVEKPTEDEIVDISYKYAVSLFGDRTDGFSFSSVTFYEDMYNYTVVFAKNYGKDGFVTGETIICEVFEDGTVYSCAMNNAYDLSAFNDDTVKNVTEENIKQ